MVTNFTRRVSLPVSADEAYAWHDRPGAFERLNPVFDPVVVEERVGGLEVGASTKIKMKIGPITQRWTAVHTACEPGRMFRDEQRGGPFASWVHTHRFIPEGPNACTLEDSIEYEAPFGGIGSALAGKMIAESLERVFAYRHAVTQGDLTRHARFLGQQRLKVAIVGSSGLVGTALAPFLTTAGHQVVRVRRGPEGPLQEDLEGADAVVHLAGAGMADERWSDERRQLLVDSRVKFTQALVRTLGKLSKPPRVLLSGGAVGVYGDRSDEVLTEDSPVGVGGPRGAKFVAQLCQDWEAAAQPATQLGTRVVNLRIGVVFSANGGALAKMLPPFKAGVGGPMGNGTQWQGWISLEDLLGAIEFLLHTESVSGPVNVVAPTPVTSREQAGVLSAVLDRRPAPAAPGFALRAMFGEMAEAMLLVSQRVVPKRLQDAGFTWLYPGLEGALRFTLGRSGDRF